MQNKPNPQNTKTNLTPYPKKHYAKITALQPQKNKPNSNPIQPTPRPTLPNNQSKTISPKLNYAKQTQSQKHQNQPNPISHKAL